jgi:hypothetical protein
MAIDGHGRQEALPLLSRAYINAPRAPPHPLRTPQASTPPLALARRVTDWSSGRRAIAAARAPSLSVELSNLPSSLPLRIGGLPVLPFKFAGSLTPPMSRRRCRLRILAASVDLRHRCLPRSSLSPAEASTCGEKAFPHPLFVPPEPHAQPLLAGRPPPWAPRLGRRLNRPCKHPFSFAVVLATHRCSPPRETVARNGFWPSPATPTVAHHRLRHGRRRPAACARGQPLDRAPTAQISAAVGQARA